MCWSIGYDEKWKRDIGYGVPCICDYPGCNKSIDRGLSYVCGSDPYGGENGCGLFFCSDHFYGKEVGGRYLELCGHCIAADCLEFEPKPDTEEWREWKRTDESWSTWRKENPDLAKSL